MTEPFLEASRLSERAEQSAERPTAHKAIVVAAW
jgi:hypothetical protein